MSSNSRPRLWKSLFFDGIADWGNAMKLEVLGTGCAKCKSLYAAAEKALALKKGITASLIKVEDIEKIMAHGVMQTPALVINGKIKSMGRIPTASEIAGWLKP